MAHRLLILGRASEISAKLAAYQREALVPSGPKIITDPVNATACARGTIRAFRKADDEQSLPSKLTQTGGAHSLRTGTADHGDWP